MSDKKIKKAGCKEKKRGRILSTVILIAAIAVMAFSLWKLIPILLDYKMSEDTYEELIGECVDLGEDAEDADTEDDGGYNWAAVRIDFDSLKAINPDVIGWIRFDDTETVPVDYPILYGETNDTYLHMNLYRESYSAGSIFLEAANSPDFSDYYNIIYGHNMKNGSMFGSLKKYRREEDFYESNPCFTIYTESAAYRYQIFSYEEVKDDSEIYTVGYQPYEIYQSLIDAMVAGSMNNTGITPDCSDRIVTLSTCTSTGDNYRFVLHAVLVDQAEYE
ncbi:MAG: class B sortase [Lachnospiraceae bacterium]|nr:class B sortase [Lachnospiraceae bacterium]